MANFEEVDEARKLLGLRETATLEEIKQAYRRMAFHWHPDRGGEDPEREEKMKKLNWAYKLLIRVLRLLQIQLQRGGCSQSVSG